MSTFYYSTIEDVLVMLCLDHLTTPQHFHLLLLLDLYHCELSSGCRKVRECDVENVEKL